MHIVGSSNVNQKLQGRNLGEKREGAIPVLVAIASQHHYRGLQVQGPEYNGMRIIGENTATGALENSAMAAAVKGYRAANAEVQTEGP